jgi:hypothetical protein
MSHRKRDRLRHLPGGHYGRLHSRYDARELFLLPGAPTPSAEGQSPSKSKGIQCREGKVKSPSRDYWGPDERQRGKQVDQEAPPKGPHDHFSPDPRFLVPQRMREGQRINVVSDAPIKIP